MFFTINLKKLIIFCLVLIIVQLVIFAGISFSSKKNSPKTKVVVCIDAGHGGRDGGCVGKTTGAKESDLTLSITKKLASYLKASGMEVVLTRENENGLYGGGLNKKKEDMEERKRIINKSNCDVVISIHINSFNDSSVRGAQVFFDETDDNSKRFAEDIQKILGDNLPASKKDVKTGDFFLLKCRDVPSILVECGYLSNAEDEALLITESHQEKIAYTLFCGIVKFFNYSYA